MTAVSLHHLVTELHRPDQSPSQILEERISAAQWQATLYNIAEKTCYVAFLAILGVVLASSYQLIALAEMSSLIVAGSALFSPLLLLAPIKFSQLSTFYATQAQEDIANNAQLCQIAHWNQAEIEDFFRREGLRIDRVPPQTTLLPLIARFQVLKNKASAIQQEARNSLRSLEESFTRQEAEQGAIDPLKKQKIRFENACVHHARIEGIAMPAALQAATLLQLIQNPTVTDIDLEPQEITGVGKWVPRPYAERAFAKLQPAYDDTYFQFLPALNRLPLTSAEIERTELNPAALRRLLYPRG